MRDALHGEVVRRQELLRAAGNYASLRDYERDRERGAKLAPLPTLFIVLDEFSELLAAKPEFIDLFVMIGRVGRSLGVHLLLASQRLEEGRLRGLDTQLSYRIGLRTYSAAESRIVLGVPDAYELPSRPGNGYLKTEATEMTRFKAAYVSGPSAGEPETAQGAVASSRQIRPMVVPYSPGYVKPKVVLKPAAQTAPADDGGQPATPGQSLFEVVIRQLAGHGPQAHQIWLPPLDLPPALDHLLPPLSITPQYGCTADGWAGRGKLHVIAGIVDRPFDQRRDPLWADLSGAAGNVGVAGAPRSGKSTVLRTLICSLALLHTPQEVQFYCLDFGGGGIGALAGLPHVGGVATRLQGRTGAPHGRGGPGDPGTARSRLRRARHRVHRGLPGHAGERGDRRRRLWRRLPRHRWLAHPAAGIRATGARHHRAGSARPRVRHPRGGGDQQVVGVQASHQGPARH